MRRLSFFLAARNVYGKERLEYMQNGRKVFFFSFHHPPFNPLLYVCGETSDNRGMSKCENVPLWCGGEAYHLRLMIGDNYFLRLFLFSPRQSSDYHRPTIDVQSFFRRLSIYLVIRSFSRRLLSGRM